MNREKTLSLPSGLEALHDPLAASGRLMRILCAIVQALMLPMLHARHHNPLCSGVAGQLVRDHHPWNDPLLLEQLAQQALGRLCIPATLNQDVEHDAVLVDRASGQWFRPAMLITTWRVARGNLTPARSQNRT